MFSPRGDLLAIAGRRGYVHFVDWARGGARLPIGSVKSNAPVKSLWWSKGGDRLWTLSEDSEVYVGRLEVSEFSFRFRLWSGMWRVSDKIRGESFLLVKGKSEGKCFFLVVFGLGPIRWIIPTCGAQSGGPQWDFGLIPLPSSPLEYDADSFCLSLVRWLRVVPSVLDIFGRE